MTTPRHKDGRTNGALAGIARCQKERRLGHDRASVFLFGVANGVRIEYRCEPARVWIEHLPNALFRCMSTDAVRATPRCAPRLDILFRPYTTDQGDVPGAACDPSSLSL